VDLTSVDGSLDGETLQRQLDEENLKAKVSAERRASLLAQINSISTGQTIDTHCEAELTLPTNDLLQVEELTLPTDTNHEEELTLPTDTNHEEELTLRADTDPNAESGDST
jgi:5-methylcytosine-specific restriction endonuclease McrBC GTP-binding regulatory subunit McrB